MTARHAAAVREVGAGGYLKATGRFVTVWDQETRSHGDTEDPTYG